MQRAFSAPKYTHSTQDMVIGTRCADYDLTPLLACHFPSTSHTFVLFPSFPPFVSPAPFLSSLKLGQNFLQDARRQHAHVSFCLSLALPTSHFVPSTQHQGAINTRAASHKHALAFSFQKINGFQTFLYSNTHTHIPHQAGS